MPIVPPTTSSAIWVRVRATSADSAYDGKVDFQDLSLFSYLYFEPAANRRCWTYPRAIEADFGPTTNNKTYGTGQPVRHSDAGRQWR